MGSVLRVPPCRTHWWEKYKGFVCAGKEPREGAGRLRSPADLPLNAKIAGVPRERAKKKNAERRGDDLFCIKSRHVVG